MTRGLERAEQITADLAQPLAALESPPGHRRPPKIRTHGAPPASQMGHTQNREIWVPSPTGPTFMATAKYSAIGAL